MGEVVLERALLDFDMFYERSYGAVLAVGLAITGDRRSAEDLAQEAFLAALAQWDVVSGLDDPLAWVRRVAANKSVSHVRRRLAEVRAVKRLRGRRRPGVELPSSSRDFWDAAASLPRRQREVVALFYVADLGVADVAEVLGCAPGTVKAHLHAARHALASKLHAEVSDD